MKYDEQYTVEFSWNQLRIIHEYLPNCFWTSPLFDNIVSIVENKKYEFFKWFDEHSINVSYAYLTVNRIFKNNEYASGIILIFENKNDAIKFKMRWY